MTVDWTPHRFSGGALALDMANTVVLRGDPRGFDRFADAAEIARFAEAAAVHRADELGGRRLAVADAVAAKDGVVELREAIDALFRARAGRRSPPEGALPRLLRACAAALDGEEEAVFAEAFDAADVDTAGEAPVAFTAAVAKSALGLLCDDAARRIRICANCNWLFLDRSRNGSRVWCDMAVCGNRQKARRHYGRRKTEEAKHG
jgi:predicted RNA-binding Zn ribbon-like protein